MSYRKIGLTSLGVLALAAIAPAQVFSDDFDVDHTANWKVNIGSTVDGNANFFFDYSTFGIPSANGSGGTTRGTRLITNRTAGIFAGMSVSPLGKSFTGDYTLSADVWLNFLGPAPGGGTGTTQIAGMGIMTSGTVANYAGAGDSAFFMSTLDGNSSADYRAYAPSALSSYGDTATIGGIPVYSAGAIAGSRNASNAYYAGFVGQSAPAAQTLLFPTQTGTALVGTTAFKWHKWRVEKVGSIVSWYIDSLKIARVDMTGQITGGSNILLGISDTNAGTSASDLTCVIFDNVNVVPEPATMAALGLGVVALIRRKRK